MRATTFAERNGKELLRDPLSLVFMVGLPILLLLFLHLMNGRVPNDVFEVASLAPGIAVFGLSFIALFAGGLLANDRKSSFLARLLASPLRAFDFVVGYTLPLMGIALAQCALSFAAALLLGLDLSIHLLTAMLVLFPAAVLFVGVGVLLGIAFSPEQIGGVASVLVIAATLLGGTWMDLSVIGGAFETIAYVLPFAHAVDATRDALAGDLAGAWPHVAWCVGYAVVVFSVAVFAFRKKTSR